MKPDPTPTLEDLQAMPGALPVPHIQKFGPKTEERHASNAADYLSSIALGALRQPHIVVPEWNGTGMSDWARARCTCGWCGPKRFGHEDNQSTLLQQDKRGHLEGSK